MSPFSNATLLITGGTGSFGNTVLKHFLTTDIGQIRIFSRDEKKQDDMRHELQARHPEHAGQSQVLHRRRPGYRSPSGTPCRAWTTSFTQRR